MNTLDPQIAAELEELEALFAEDIRATAAPMPLALKTRLEEQAAAGFPGKRAKRDERRGLPRWALPAMGAAATVGVALLVAGSALRDDSTTGVTQTLSGGDTAATSEAAPQSAAPFQDAAGGSAGASGDEDAARSSKQAAPGTVLPEPAPTAPDTLRRDRKVERGVELTLRVGAGQLEEAADGVVRTTQRLGGYVADSQVAARERGGSASFTLRIPTKRLDAATSQLSKLGHIVALDQSSRDITGAFVSAEEQLSDARAERKALLRALANATTPGHIASLRARIRLNRSEIAQYKGQLAALRRRADLATISVEVVARGKASAAPGGGGDWSPGDAAGDAVRVLEVAAGVLLIALAVLVPLSLLGLLGVLGGRAARRRRREGALDAA